ncbi:carboxylating nicotinate-nucleotide diphosphorylase [Sulfurimonas marina]|uniref:nicotinate-nucleotide diphosphorylase (carboxylating) n=1 Tax=Sulfurimonas marina TaxID=2590551 RepID=A0A7M1AW39_9BACT|nr:carboxylating nicotinate-nucleotide diphosphorylase [Sulfurimonas marina]QOP41663.1 carboxylating nicotinate-nucleotide diphosphorylase [Sulfurimonas marina]
MIKEFVKAALAEDVGRGDLYALVEESVPTKADIIAKCDGVFAGATYINALAKEENLEVIWGKKDGETFVKGDVIAIINGSSHDVLKTERTLLDLALHASSIATLTRKYADIIAPYGVKLLDTRKTRPMLRVFEKYATRCGGATNHRMGLDDSLMIKDTHLKTIENLSEYIAKARKVIPFTAKIEVEAETLEIAKMAFEAQADIVMCDNMTPEQVKEVVEYRDANHPYILIEASGNISLKTIESYAKTGVDAISSGSLIHQANWIDLSMKIS